MPFFSANFFDFGYSLFLIYAITIDYGLCLLQMVELEIPRYGIVNGNVVLYCRHDAERDLVHKVEWLKSGMKIFQYVKGRKPPFRYFQLPGATITNRSENFIEISNLEFSASGIYSCEVSIETPIYTKASSNHEFIVIQPQNHDPKITFSKPVYSVGEILEANCTTSYGRPPPQITWFINDEKVYETQMATFSNIYSMGTTWWDRLENSINQLSIEVNKLHLGKNGVLQLKCLATIPAYNGPSEKYADVRNHTVNIGVEIIEVSTPNIQFVSNSAKNSKYFANFISLMGLSMVFLLS